jgi:hypothetical protein
LTGEKQKVKKKLRFAPYVVDPCTDKKEYLQKHLQAIAPRYNLVDEEISSSEEKKIETSDKNSITNSSNEKPVKFQTDCINLPENLLQNGD